MAVRPGVYLFGCIVAQVDTVYSIVKQLEQRVQVAAEAMLNHTWFKDLTANVLSTSILTYSLIGTTEAYYGGNGMYILNDVENYADARQVTFTVLDAQGDPAENCYVGLYQYGDYMYKNLAELYTDGQGVAQWTLGRAVAHHQEQGYRQREYAAEHGYDTCEQLHTRVCQHVLTADQIAAAAACKEAQRQGQRMP